jgi:hypothetical protein
VKVWGWDLFTANPTNSTAKDSSHQNHSNHGSANQSSVLGAPTLFGAVLAGSADDRRGLSLATTYYAGAKGGYRRILTAPARDAEAATLWRLNLGEGGHLGHGGVADSDVNAELIELTQFRPTIGAPAASGFNLASVSTTTGSVIAISERAGNGPIWTFLPESSDSYQPVQTVFRPVTKGSVRLAGS